MCVWDDIEENNETYPLKLKVLAGDLRLDGAGCRSDDALGAAGGGRFLVRRAVYPGFREQLLRCFTVRGYGSGNQLHNGKSPEI